MFCTEAFTHRSFYTKNVYTKKFLHTEAFTYRSFTQRNFYTHFTRRRFFTKKNLYTQESLHTGIFTQRNLYAQTRLHTVAFTHRSLCTKKSFLISLILSHFPDRSPSVIFTSSFSGSFGQLSPSFSFHFARCSVHPRFVLAPPAAKQTKREPRNTLRLERWDRVNYLAEIATRRM